MPTSKDTCIVAAIHQSTPLTLVHNNQGLAVRSLMYYRQETEKTTQLRISLQRYNTGGYLKHSLDARLSENYLQDPDSTIPNQSQVNTLSGTILQSKNVDAGLRITILDVRGLNLLIVTHKLVVKRRQLRPNQLTFVSLSK